VTIAATAAIMGATTAEAITAGMRRMMGTYQTFDRMRA
jgi:hypothetical protein